MGILYIFLQPPYRIKYEHKREMGPLLKQPKLIKNSMGFRYRTSPFGVPLRIILSFFYWGSFFFRNETIAGFKFLLELFYSEFQFQRGDEFHISENAY